MKTKLSADKRPTKFGWAAGRYQNTCCRCNKCFLGDKRAIMCADCAYSTHIKNKFEQLEADLISGEISLTHVQIAIRSSIKHSKAIPDEIKGLLCGGMCEGNASSSGLIFEMFQTIANVIGSVELAYRRGLNHDNRQNDS